MVGCERVVEAPPDLDALLHTFFRTYATADDAELVEAAVAWEAITDEAALLDEPVDGFQSRLTREDIAAVDLFAPPDDDGTWTLPDPALARPIFLVNRFTCGIDALERVLIHLDQQDLFGGYDSYVRTYTSSDEAYLARTAPTLSWEALAAASYFGAGSYEELLLGGVRRVPLPPDTPFDGDAMLLGRTHIPFPATNLSGPIQFRQDYQIEVYAPWEGGDVIHLYGIWRELELGALGTMESDAVARVTLNNLAGWDDKTEALCAEGRP
jgi:hypothetical protein